MERSIILAPEVYVLGTKTTFILTIDESALLVPFATLSVV